MPSPEAQHFARVIYDDRRRRPWVLVWGENHELGSYVHKEAADDAASELRGILDAFWDWLEHLDDEIEGSG